MHPVRTYALFNVLVVASIQDTVQMTVHMMDRIDETLDVVVHSVVLFSHHVIVVNVYNISHMA